MTELPIACILSERELVAHRAGFLSELRRHRQEIRWLPDGASLRYPSDSDVLALLVEFLRLESQCCPFLRFRLTVEPAGGPLWFELTGPPGTREFLAAEIGHADETLIA